MPLNQWINHLAHWVRLSLGASCGSVLNLLYLRVYWMDIYLLRFVRHKAKGSSKIVSCGQRKICSLDLRTSFRNPAVYPGSIFITFTGKENIPKVVRGKGKKNFFFLEESIVFIFFFWHNVSADYVPDIFFFLSFDINIFITWLIFQIIVVIFIVFFLNIILPYTLFVLLFSIQFSNLSRMLFIFSIFYSGWIFFVKHCNFQLKRICSFERHEWSYFTSLSLGCISTVYRLGVFVNSKFLFPSLTKQNIYPIRKREKIKLHIWKIYTLSKFCSIAINIQSKLDYIIKKNNIFTERKYLPKTRVGNNITS